MDEEECDGSCFLFNQSAHDTHDTTLKLSVILLDYRRAPLFTLFFHAL